MVKIWQFEEKFVQSCKMVLDEVLRLLDCDLSHSLFLAGVAPQTNGVTVIPDNSVVSTNELEERLDPASESYVSYADGDLRDAEWGKQIQRHDAACWGYWRSIRKAVDNLLFGKDLASAVSP